jgi:hypothetical protein
VFARCAAGKNRRRLRIDGAARCIVNKLETRWRIVPLPQLQNARRRDAKCASMIVRESLDGGFFARCENNLIENALSVTFFVDECHAEAQ